MDDRQKLMRRIQILDFACFEAALYLDTHNTDREALAYYNKNKKLARELHEEYQEKYGPLTIGGKLSDTQWEWSKGPWPWEPAAN